MKHFYLIANPSKKGSAQVARQIAEYLQAHGAVCEGSAQEKRREGAAYGYTDKRCIPKETQCVITLGGDGTLIQAARDLVELQIPMIGVNMGTLGYLTQVAHGEAVQPMLDALLEDNFRLERRMMLEGAVTKGRKADSKKEEKGGIALNDIVLTRKDVMQVLKFQVYVNGEFLTEYTADGMIVATPTGSTAYNLSAGGPIVRPGAKLIVLTPVCPHSINSRSIILSHKDRVGIRVLENVGQKQMAVFDGDQVVNLDDTEVLEIRESESFTTLIQLKDVPFLVNIREKLTRV
ncbi:MAG: NAD(+)/NADH kinase [Lachnospiraceae bacterium]|nr:NAD(+)/NADH kinase [Lachnospiraceae bacterium]MCI9560252.1 NAD(+)/NADH kinase [Lachnospiraceae bacterium]NBH16987.1 NAD(+)/NADH kinase [Clostridiaceae bacterium]